MSSDIKYLEELITFLISVTKVKFWNILVKF